MRGVIRKRVASTNCVGFKQCDLGTIPEGVGFEEAAAHLSSLTRPAHSAQLEDCAYTISYNWVAEGMLTCATAKQHSDH